MKGIYQIIASFSLDFYIENRPDKEKLEAILDQDPYEVINTIALKIEDKIKSNKTLVKDLERFYKDELSHAINKNMFMEINLREMNIKGVEFFIAFCNYVAQKETHFIVNEILYKRGCI